MRLTFIINLANSMMNLPSILNQNGC